MAKIRIADRSLRDYDVGRILVFLRGSAAGKTVYIGGTMSLTGPYAEDSAAIFAAYEDYVKYVNETKTLGTMAKREMACGRHGRAALAGRRAQACQGPQHL